MAVLEIKGVSCGYGDTDIVKNLSLTVKAGETVALAGPNGCGKTTLLRAARGLIPITEGEILIDGVSVSEMSHKERARKLALLSQTGAGGDYFDYTVMDTVLMGRYARQKGSFLSEASDSDKAAAERYIAAAELNGCEERLITELSGGQLQRVLLARAFTQEPDILFLDEPANHLDIKSGIELAKLLKEFTASGGAAVGVFHDISFAAAVSDRIMLMKDGKSVLCADSAQVLKSEELPQVFETDVRSYMKKILELWE